MRYDFFIAGRWRNQAAVKEVLEAVRTAGFTAYCFIENEYKGEKIEFTATKDIDALMKATERLEQSDPFIHKVFETDMAAERASDKFILVLPAGISGNVELGAAYGMGKPCYGVGKPEKAETLYSVFSQIFPSTKELTIWLQNV